MTKEKIENIIKRYKYVVKALKEGKAETSFYIGNRKRTIEITEEVLQVLEIIDDIRQTIKDAWIQQMINGILQGVSDCWLISSLPCAKSMYYVWKSKFIEKVYCCCIARDMIPYEELLKEGMA